MSYFTETFEIAYQSLNEEGMRLGADRDSSNARKIKKWYKKFCTSSKSKAENIEQIDERLKVLRASKKEMEETLSNENGRHGTEHALYMLKQVIPFNSIARLIDKQDVYAGLVPFLGWYIGPVVKFIMFDKMLEGMIKDTDDAIEYLEKKKKEL